MNKALRLHGVISGWVLFHERLHRTIKQVTMYPPSATPEAQQQRCDDLRWDFNTVWPHQTLGQAPPTQVLCALISAVYRTTL